MPGFEQGDVVRVPFPYTDRSTRQHRPALVVSAGGIGENAALLWVVMITSAENRAWANDIPLDESYGQAGLPVPSVIRPCKLATIEARHAEPLGRIGSDHLSLVTAKLRDYLGFGEPDRRPA
ncbi:MAG TPA: type II toxin-antitoxin system PemK/MazF family toxin [Bosea sp. (in: a-proteobacteria)]